MKGKPADAPFRAGEGFNDNYFRMRPGSDVKLIAEQVDGFIWCNDTIYYAQAGSIHSAISEWK